MSENHITEEDLDLVFAIGEVLEAFTLALFIRNGGGSAMATFGAASHCLGTALNAEIRAASRRKEDLSKATPGEFVDLYVAAAKDQARALGVLPDFERILDHLAAHRPPAIPGVS